MRLHHVLVLDASLKTQFSYSPLLSSSDSFDTHLLASLRAGLPQQSSEASPCTFTCDELPVAALRKGDLLYIVACGLDDDELAVSSLLTNVYRVITAACEEEPPTAPRILAYYGKLVVCLHEAFSGQGIQLQRSIEDILRNAKLKAPL